MPNYRNHFSAPTYWEQAFYGRDGTLVGTLRVKPSSIMWRPAGSHTYYRVWLDRFADWMTAIQTRAKRVKQ